MGNSAKWIDEVQNILWSDWGDDGIPWDKLSVVLERVNRLLILASVDVESDELSEEILKEIRDD